MVFQHFLVVNTQPKHYKPDEKTDLEYSDLSHQKAFFKTYEKSSANWQKT